MSSYVGHQSQLQAPKGEIPYSGSIPRFVYEGARRLHARRPVEYLQDFNLKSSERGLDILFRRDSMGALVLRRSRAVFLTKGLS
jgi:hypothetical protein